VSELNKADHLEIAQLQEQGQPAAEVRGTIAYCLWYDWVGISSHGTRIWLNSDSRDLLNR
jgi:hypothetical protein